MSTKVKLHPGGRSVRRGSLILHVRVKLIRKNGAVLEVVRSPRSSDFEAYKTGGHKQTLISSYERKKGSAVSHCKHSGEGDRVKCFCQLIFQAGVSNIVTALDDVPVGEVWTPPALQCLRRAIEEEGGLSWTIVEVLPVHEAIKSGKTSALRAKCASAARRSVCWPPSLLSLSPSLSQVHRQLEGVHEEPGCSWRHDHLLRLHAGRQLDQNATRLQVHSQFSPRATA